MPDHSFLIPSPAWTRRLDATLERAGRPSNLSLRAFPMAKAPAILLRILAGVRSRRRAGWDPDDVLLVASSRNAPGPHQGVPLGGIGAGAIGRGWRGDFRRWQRRPGIVHHGIVFADQFSLFVQRPDQAGQAQVLYPGRPRGKSLSAWRWEMDPACATYHALYPRAWTVYEQPAPGIRLTCRQLSPILPHNYRESSFPVGHFLWRIENTGTTAATVGLMFSFQNGRGTDGDLAGGHHNRPFRLPGNALESERNEISDQESSLSPPGQPAIVGVELRHVHRQPRAAPLGQKANKREIFEDSLAFAIAARAGEGVDISRCTRFVTTDDGAALWRDFAQDGRLDNAEDESPAAAGEAIGAAVGATLTVPPGASREVAFALAWDMPVMRAGFGTAYHPRYTVFYGHDGTAAPHLAAEALLHAAAWETAIAGWQQPILDDPGLPGWYKMALFNELYYLADGGTLWVYPAESASSIVEQQAERAVAGKGEPGASKDDFGHFAYLEGHEYRMLNTYDVHFYASFALAMLWPKLELALQHDVALATLAELADPVTPAWSGQSAQRKVIGAVPHDLGWPDEDPWWLVNGYSLHDTAKWKDLNPKFVLQVYRDLVATSDLAFVASVWPAVELAMNYAGQFDRDGDGLVENDGFPDQTYDTWPVAGPSAYTGGLWLASLAASAALADLLGKDQEAAGYRAILARGQIAYRDKLWNGRYFNYDSSGSQHSDSIMADQLAGWWYARACGLPPFVEPDQARSALHAVFDHNVMGFRAGTLGAINGMRPDGQVDRRSMQSQEVWPGVTYALAAAMLQEGMIHEAFQTAEGAVRTTYERMGYWFQTPEAWDRHGNYRSIAYMRPLAIWAMQWALERRKGQ